MRTGLLELLRFTVASLIFLLLLQPEWTSQVKEQGDPELFILWDDTESMETLDAMTTDEDTATSKIVSRKELAQQIIANPIWNQIAESENLKIRTASFQSLHSDKKASQLSQTDLNQAITEAVEDSSRLRGLVLLSDGDWNSGLPPATASQQLRISKTPIFSIPLGSLDSLPDLEVSSINAPTYGVVGEQIQIPFTIESSLSREVRTIVQLKGPNGHQVSKDITIPPQSTYYDQILWKLEDAGASTLELSLPVAEGELIESNNTRSFQISAKEESIKVLVIESLPRWEYRFLRNALSRDPGVEVDCLLLHPELGVGNGPDYIQSFPDQPGEIQKYDVIFLGDIGIGENQLTAEQATLIRGLVENQASGIVFLPGPQGLQKTLRDSPLGELIPVELDAQKPLGTSSQNPSPLVLTAEGRKSLLTSLSDNEADNPAVWKRLPGFYWSAASIKAKTGARVLAVHDNKRNRYGRLPLIVSQSFGSGKVLFMGVDSAWRWRKGVADRYHYRFWRQVARWMSYQRNLASGDRLRIFYSPERPKPNQIVSVQVNAFAPSGIPLRKGTLYLDITSPEGPIRRIELPQENELWGVFSGSFTPDISGSWQLEAQIAGAPDQKIQTTILTEPILLEKKGKPSRPDVMKEMSQITQGAMITPERLSDLSDLLRQLPAQEPRLNRTPLWSHWGTLLTLILLLSIFWIGRKFNGTF